MSGVFQFQVDPEMSCPQCKDLGLESESIFHYNGGSGSCGVDGSDLHDYNIYRCTKGHSFTAYSDRVTNADGVETILKEGVVYEGGRIENGVKVSK